MSFASSGTGSTLALNSVFSRQDASFLRQDATVSRRDATFLRHDATVLRTFGKPRKSDLRRIAFRFLTNGVRIVEVETRVQTAPATQNHYDWNRTQSADDGTCSTLGLRWLVEECRAVARSFGRNRVANAPRVAVPEYDHRDARERSRSFSAV